MEDNYVYIGCVNGNCPLVVEEEIYGIRTSTCEDYCGTDKFSGCNTCALGGEMCENCIHKYKGE